MEREDRSATQNGTERNENGTIKKERERNNLAEGPRSRTERNDLKKSRNVPSPSIEPLLMRTSV